jgi:predicted amidohydrolase YtcJ
MDRRAARASVACGAIKAAYELHQADLSGWLEIGKLADFIGLGRNWLTVPAEKITTNKVQQTEVRGDVVHKGVTAG